MAMAKSTEDIIKTASEKLNQLNDKLPENPSADERVALRNARKKLKRAQRRSTVEATTAAKRDGMDKQRQVNMDKLSEREAKRKAAEQSTLAAAAEAQSAENAESESTSEE